MKKLLIIFVLIFGYQLKASEEMNTERRLATSWAKSLNLNENEECDVSIVPGGSAIKMSAIERHINVLEELIKIYKNNSLEHKVLDANLAICSKYISDKSLHHAVRVYARLNLSIIEKAQAAIAYSDVAKETHIQILRQNILISLALARKSGVWKEAQTQMAYDIYNNVKNIFYFFVPIELSEIDVWEKKLEEDKDRQYLPY